LAKRSSKKKAKGKPAKPSALSGRGSCPLCGALDGQPETCPQCGAETVGLHANHVKRIVRVTGRVCLRKPAPLEFEDPVRAGKDEEHFSIRLPSGLAVVVSFDHTTEVLGDPRYTSPLPPPQDEQVALVGSPHNTFETHQDGFREAAHEVYGLSARVVAVGPDCDSRLAKHPLLNRPDARAEDVQKEGAEERDSAPPWLGRLPDDVTIRELPCGDGDKGLRIRVGKNFLPGLLLIPWVMVMIGSLGGLITWQTWAAIPSSPFVYIFSGLSLLFMGVAVLGIFTTFRRTTIIVEANKLRVKHLPLPNPFRRLWQQPRSNVLELVTKDGVLLAKVKNGDEAEVLPDGCWRQRDFVRRCLCWLMPLRGSQHEPEEDSSKTTVPTSRLIYAWYAVPILLFGSLMWLPFCQLTVGRPVWTAAAKKAEACSLATDLLGTNITWALGEQFTQDMEDGTMDLSVKGSLRRGEISIDWYNRKDGSIKLKNVTIKAHGKKICVLCCKLYRKGRQHK
jgi:hypothetical protein